MKQDVTVLDGGPATKVFLMRAGQAGCIAIKKELSVNCRFGEKENEKKVRTRKDGHGAGTFLIVGRRQC